MSEALDFNLLRIWRIVRSGKMMREVQDASLRRTVPTITPAQGRKTPEPDGADVIPPHGSFGKPTAVTYPLNSEYGRSIDGRPNGAGVPEGDIAERKTLAKIWRRLVEFLRLSRP